jgi:hypothetical protein
MKCHVGLLACLESTLLMRLRMTDWHLQVHNFGRASFAACSCQGPSSKACSSTETTAACQQCPAQPTTTSQPSLQHKGLRSATNTQTQRQLQPWQQPYLHPRQLVHRPSSSSSRSLSHYLCTRSSQVGGFSSLHQQNRSLHLAPPFLVEDYTPSAVTTYRQGRMPAKLHDAAQELADCKACPRNCGVNR